MVPRRGPGSTGGDVEFRRRLIRAVDDTGRILTGTEIERFAAHHRLLLQWGRKMNLTGLTDPDAVVRRHFLEPIRVADLLEGRGTLLDLGSGNGFPAVPLNVLHPGLDLVMVESSAKKSEFLWAVVRELGLTRARVETRRIERGADIDDLLPATYLTFRAIRGRELLRGAGKALLHPGGRLLAFVAPEDSEALRNDGIAGLRWTGSRALGGDERGVVAVLEPED